MYYGSTGAERESRIRMLNCPPGTSLGTVVGIATSTGINVVLILRNRRPGQRKAKTEQKDTPSRLIDQLRRNEFHETTSCRCAEAGSSGGSRSKYSGWPKLDNG